MSPLGRLWTALYAVGIEVARASLAQAARALRACFGAVAHRETLRRKDSRARTQTKSCSARREEK